mmetsp:Transcript_40573/g.91170  ORF Transcript_40573/g.91170 Transcript_40573/m.91170 type:complete len:152 (-) Transcript_40573:337-792(-)
MDQFELLGRRLRVSWAQSTHSPAGQQGAPPAPPPAPPPSVPPGQAPGQAPGLAGQGPASWRCTLLKNMVGAEEASDPELAGEIKDECAKYGPVESVKVAVLAGQVRIFVLFKEPPSAGAAVAALNGRFFGGRVVEGAPYDHNRLLAGDLTG